MASTKQQTVTASKVESGGLGHRNDRNLKASFSGSPLLKEYSDEAVENICKAALQGNGGPGTSIPDIGVSEDGVINDGGYMFGLQDLNYTEAPNLEEVETGGAGLPATPYTPNTSSPGAGSVHYADIPEYEGDLPKPTPQFGVGLGGTVSPSVTSKGVSSQTLGDYVSGESYDGSD
tara:strand:+ start:627 stop:1154 length:528 start_codon:yes stop_codon:yes gene_type:complete